MLPIQIIPRGSLSYWPNLYPLIQVKNGPRRQIILALQISSATFTLVNIYIPPPFSVEVLSKLSFQLLNRPPGPLLCVSDLNAILDPAVGHLGGWGVGPSPPF